MDQTLASGSAPDTDGRDWKKILLNYRDPDTTRSIIEIVTTVVPLIVVWAAAWASLSISYLLTLVFIIPASLLVLRLFMIQHDCGHGAFFHGRLVNDWVGRIIGIVTLTPYDVWRRSHAVHHATSGNLDLRGVGDIDTLTVDEYRALPRWRKLAYRLYRNPIVMFVIGPAYLFLLQHRLPIGMMRAGWQPWVSALATDLGVAAFVGGMMYLVGWKAFLIIHLPIIVLDLWQPDGISAVCRGESVGTLVDGRASEPVRP